jgi:hypothetical protein
VPAAANPRPLPASRPRRRPLWFRLSRDAVVGLVVLAVLLIAARAALPHVVLWYANRTLDEVPGYHGVIRDVDIALWRGAYQIEGLEVKKSGGKIPVPFFSCPEIDFSVQWREIFNGALVGEIDFRRPTLNLVSGPTEETTQNDLDSRWQDKVAELFPLRINRFEMHDGEAHFRNFHTEPKVDVEIDDLHVLARNLTNSLELSKTLVATIEAQGRPFGGAVLDVRTDLDPYQKDPTFDLNAKLERVDIRKLNDFLRAYGHFDAEGGTLAVYAELAASNGAFTGYVKPIIQDLNILDLGEEAKSPFHKVWEGAVDLVSRIFRNLPKDRFATKIEYSGRFDQPKYSIWSIIGQAVKNAFIKALPPNLEESVGLGDAKNEASGDDEEAQEKKEEEEEARKEKEEEEQERKEDEEKETQKKAEEAKED